MLEEGGGGVDGGDWPSPDDESDGDDDAWERQSGLSVPPARAAPPKKERAPKAKQKKVEYYGYL